MKLNIVEMIPREKFCSFQELLQSNHQPKFLKSCNHGFETQTEPAVWTAVTENRLSFQFF